MNLLIAAVALLAWWPWASYWQSDDFLAVTYAFAPERALQDLAGPQYAAPALASFYRPLITLSFALDTWLGGGAPFVSHASNALAHAVSTLLLAALGQRLLGASSGRRLALLWAVWPGHAGSILWAVGRVDSHTTVWIMATAWLTVRWLDAGARRWPWPALATFTLALLSKELAFVTPGIVTLLALARAAPGERVRLAVRATLPFALLFALYLAWRWTVLGQLVGGYSGARFALGPALQGAGFWLAHMANPLLQLELPTALHALGYAGVALGAVFALHAGHGRKLALALLTMALCMVPTAPFWAETAELRNLRYFYLPSAASLAVFALGGRWPTAVALALATAPLLSVRTDYASAHAEAARVHQSLRQHDQLAAPGDMLVAGLPREDRRHNVLLFHLFVDRLLLPPFGSGRRTFALRPLVERDGLWPWQAEEFAGVRALHALRCDAEGQLTPVAAGAPLAVLRVELASADVLDNAALLALHEGRRHDALRMPGDRARAYRVSVLTGGGMLRAVLANETPEADAGTVSLRSLLTARYASAGDDAVVLLGLMVPIAFDVAPSFPLLVEAGEWQDGQPHSFVPRARADRLPELKLAREVAAALAK